MITYEKEAFLVLLDQFALKVKQGKYNKLDYNLWRRLYTVAREKKKVEIEHKTQNSVIQISWWIKHSDDHYRKHCINLESNDDSLGRYLADELYNSNLQARVDEYETINLDARVFGEQISNKAVIDYNSINLDSIKINSDSPSLYTLASSSDITIDPENFVTV